MTYLDLGQLDPDDHLTKCLIGLDGSNWVVQSCQTARAAVPVPSPDNDSRFVPGEVLMLTVALWPRPSNE